jgi:hypothetical protein
MLGRLVLVTLLVAGVHGCVAYELEHEFWINVDGSGTVNVTARPELWTAVKGLGDPRRPRETATRESVRELFERSGLEVVRVTLTRRGGRPYLFVSARFDDVNALNGTPAFPDLRIGMRREDGRLVLEGTWARPPGAPSVPGLETDGRLAVRFHLPAKVYAHKNAFDGVERGNIVSWRESVAAALAGGPLDFGATMGGTSILLSTVLLFGASIVIGVAILLGALWLVRRHGRRQLARENGTNGSGST